MILPVWHNVDHHFIAQRSPVLADRLGVATGAGIDKVAEAISQVIESTHADLDESRRKSATQGAGSEEEEGASLFSIPATDEDQAKLITSKPSWWEYRLYAGVLVQGRIALEGKWHDHQLRLPGGSWRQPGESVPDFLSQETGTMRRQMEILNRLFEPELLERAFGPPGTAGDADLIVHIGRGVLQTYESMLDWAAELRRTTSS